MSEFDSLDSFLEDDKDYSEFVENDAFNVMYIGDQDTFTSISRKIKKIPGINLNFEPEVTKAIQLLLQDVYAIVIIENCAKYNSATASRIVRVNHPLARILIISNKKNARFLSEIINNGSVDGFITLKQATRKKLFDMITSHKAKHDINKMIVKYISDPPKLSKASFLLLDPTLPFGENVPVKYVGVMINHSSVPRYSVFFEDLLSKDEILFSGYLSGISLLGMQLFSNNEPIKEINFGGISVIMRFVGDLHFCFFVRNLTSINVKETEKLLDEIVDELVDSVKDSLEDIMVLKGGSLEKIDTIIKKLENANDFTTNILPDIIQYNERIMLYGGDLKYQMKIKHYFERKYNFRVYSSDDREECINQLNSKVYDVLLLDSNVENDDPLDFAEYAKDISPHLQVVYRLRDKRITDPIIDAINSAGIDYLVGYKASLKSLSIWIHSALKKAIEIRQQTRMGIQSTHNQAIVAKSIIRGDEKSYLEEGIPEFHGIFITKNVDIMYAYQPERPNLIVYNQELLAGVVTALNSIGVEALGSDAIGKIEMGGAHVLIQHRDEEYHYGYLINNLSPNTEVMLSKFISDYTDDFHVIVKKFKKDTTRNPRLAKYADTFNEFFIKKFEE